jgi:hypothetical protein
MGSEPGGREATAAATSSTWPLEPNATAAVAAEQIA